jgi:hypothetical protein
MFLKKHIRKKGGKAHVYWSLVESYRTPRGPRNRIVAYLGELEETDREGWANLCRTLDGKPLSALQPGLFESKAPLATDSGEADNPVPEKITVNVRGVHVKSAKDFGDVYLALILWRTLGLDELLGKLMSGGKEGIKWPLIAAMLVIARFLNPSSELHISKMWYPGTALLEVLGITPEKVYTQRLYRALDALHPHKEEIEKHLTSRLGELFEVKHDILLYDITSTYFEGEAKKNPQAKRGYSRDKRFDCKQVCLGCGVRTVLEEFARIKCCEVVLPTSAGKEISLRCITKPDGYQRTLLQRLKINIPLRLGAPRWRKHVKLDSQCSPDF